MAEPRIVALLHRDQLPEGKPVPVIHPPGHIVAIRLGEQVYALDHACCHAQASLLTAQISGSTITCRAHGYCFDLATGALLHPRGEPLRQRTWPVERRGDAWAILSPEGM